MSDNNNALLKAAEAHENDETESGCRGGCGHSAKSLEQSAMLVGIGCLVFVILTLAIGGSALISMICGGE